MSNHKDRPRWMKKSRRGFKAKPKPKVPPYDWVILTPEDWPATPVKVGSVREVLNKFLRKKSSEQVIRKSWFSEVPRIPRTLVFRVDRRSGTFAACVRVTKDLQEVSPKSSKSYSLK